MRQKFVFVFFKSISLFKPQARIVNSFSTYLYSLKEILRHEVSKKIGYTWIAPVAYALSNPTLPQPVAEIIKNSDEYFNTAKYKESYQVLAGYKFINSDEVLWRLSRGLYNMTKEANVTPAEVEKYIQEADECIERAIVLNDNNYAVQKWRAIILDAKTTLQGTKAKIASLPAFKRHIERAIELNPKDATSIHMLGTYYYNIADLAWYQRKIASTLFGQVPDASFQEALSAFSKAEETSPNFYSLNLLMLGKTYLKLGMTESAQHWLQRAASYTVKTDEDQAVTREASDLLKTIQ